MTTAISYSKIGKYFPAWYFLVLGLIYLIGETVNVKFSIYALSMCLFLSIPAIYKHKIIYLLFGIFYSIISAYFLLALFLSSLNYNHSINHRPDSGLIFAVGFPLFILSLICGLALIYQCIDFKGPNVRFKEKI